MVTTTVSPNPLDDWLDEEYAAPEIGLKPSTLTAYRKKRRGPAFSQVGRTFKYHRLNLHAWVAAGGTLSDQEGPNVLAVAPALPVKSAPMPDDKPARRRAAADAGAR